MTSPAVGEHLQDHLEVYIQYGSSNRFRWHLDR